MRLFLSIRAVPIVALTLLVGVGGVVGAQGKGANKPGHLPPGQAKKHVSLTQAVAVTRETLVVHGYQVIRVERLGSTEIIYYRRGNNGRGRGWGPTERMVVRPAGTVVVFEAAPPKVLIDINVKLGL
jgi:hypothetical protein